MASPVTKKRPFDHETAIEEVTRGYELTIQLQSLLHLLPLPKDDSGSELAGVLCDGLLQALTASLSILKSGNNIAAGEKVKSSTIHHYERQRGRRSHLQSRTKLTSMPNFDGYQWRKYGEKNIHNSKYTRSYYRCTHRDGQQCPATKQVQQKDGQDPPMFLVTYIEHHTCRTTSTLATPQLILDSSPAKQPFSFSFGSDTSTTRLDQPPLSSVTLECSGEMVRPQIGTCSTSNLPVSPARSELGPMGMEERVELGDGDTCSQGWIMDYLVDSPGIEFDDVNSFLNF